MYTVSLEDKIILFRDRLLINPAATFEYYDNMFLSSSNGRDELHGYFNPRLGLRYKPLSWLALKSNIAKYVREPSFFELFGDRGFLVGNDALKAEKGVNFDIGWDIEYNINSGFISSFDLDMAYFKNRVTDVISYIYNARGVGQAINIADSYIDGLEAGLGFKFLKHFSLISHYTWQSATNKNIIEAFNAKRLPGRFENLYAQKFEFSYHRFKLFYDFLYTDGVYYDTANLLPALIKREHNIGLMFLRGGLTVAFEVKNMGNANYQDFNGYPQPGRSYWLTIKIEA
jgi:outer membrane receptor protein involved in Fe transport